MYPELGCPDEDCQGLRGRHGGRRLDILTCAIARRLGRDFLTMSYRSAQKTECLESGPKDAYRSAQKTECLESGPKDATVRWSRSSFNKVRTTKTLVCWKGFPRLRPLPRGRVEGVAPTLHFSWIVGKNSGRDHEKARGGCPSPALRRRGVRQNHGSGGFRPGR